MVSGGFTSLRDLHYEVIPGFLPPAAISDQCFLSNPASEISPIRLHRLYAVIRANLPQDWSRLFTRPAKRRPSEVPAFRLEFEDGERIRLTTLPLRQIYTSLQSTSLESTGEERWRRFLVSPLPRVKYKALSNATLGSVFSSLNLKLLHQGLPVKSRLIHAGLVPNDLCVFCHTASETIPHLFLSCPKAILVWESIFRVFCQYTFDPSFCFNSSSYILIVFHHCWYTNDKPILFWKGAFLLLSIVKLVLWKFRCKCIVAMELGRVLPFNLPIVIAQIQNYLHTCIKSLYNQCDHSMLANILTSFLILL